MIKKRIASAVLAVTMALAMVTPGQQGAKAAFAGRTVEIELSDLSLAGDGVKFGSSVSGTKLYLTATAPNTLELQIEMPDSETMVGSLMSDDVFNENVGTVEDYSGIDSTIGENWTDGAGAIGGNLGTKVTLFSGVTVAPATGYYLFVYGQIDTNKAYYHFTTTADGDLALPPMTAPTVAVAQATGTDSGLDFTMTANADFALVDSYTVNVYANGADPDTDDPVATATSETLDMSAASAATTTKVNVPIDVADHPLYDGDTTNYEYIVTANATSVAAKGSVSTALMSVGTAPKKITLPNLSAATLTVEPGPTTITLTTTGDYATLPTGNELQHSVVAKDDPAGAYTTGAITGLTMDTEYDVYAKVVAADGNAKYYIDSTAQKFATKTTKGAEVKVVGTPKAIVVVKDAAGNQSDITDAMIAAAFEGAGVKVVAKADENKVLNGKWTANTVTLNQGKNADVVFTWTPAAGNVGEPYSTVTAKTTVYVKKAVTAGDFTATGTLNKTYDGTDALPLGATLTLGAETIGDHALVLNNTAGNTFAAAYKDAKVADNKDIVITAIAIAENDYYILDDAADSGKATLNTVAGANITTKTVTLTQTDVTVNQGETQIALDAILDSGDFVDTDDIVTVLKGAGVLNDAGFDGKLHWNATDKCFYESEAASGKNIVGALYVEDPENAGAYIKVETLSGFESGKTYYLDLAVLEMKGPTADPNHEYLINSIAAKGEEPLKTGNAYPLTDYIKLDVVTSGGGVASDYVVTYKAGDHGKLNGEATERVKRGAYPAAVPTVAADEGWTFLGWSLDGKTTIDPTTVKITKRTTFTALYSEKGQKHAAYVEGVGEGLFAPMGEMTRAEAATMLARLSADFKADGGYTSDFPDLDSGEWYYNAVAFATEKGIVEGMEDGTFRPMQKITRAEFAAMLVRYMGIAPVPGASKFPDVPGGDYWATGYINALAEAGIVDGTEEGLFMPMNNLTRAEAVKMINGAIGHVPSQSAMDANAASITNPFSDVTPDYWAYYHILEAAVEHEIPLFHGEQ